MKWIGLLGGVALLFACSSATEKIWIEGWKETRSLNVPRAGAAMVTYNNFIYMIAGIDGRSFLRSTEYAPMLADGSVGEWTMGPSLIEDRGFIDAVVRDGYIYVVGGGNGPSGHHLLQTVERAKIKADGSLGEWRRESSQTVLPRRCTKLSLIGDTLYSFGGFGGALLDSVEFAKISADGSVGEWRMASEALTIPRYVNSVKTANGNAYVIGGHDQQKGVGIADVEWNKPELDGDMKAWKKTSSLITGRYALASAKHGDTLYALGGLSGLEYLLSIEKSTLLANGELSSWQETTAMSVPRATFNSMVHNGYFYVLGGTNRDGYLRSVEFTNINEKGDLGFWGNEKDLQAYESRLAALKESAPPLPNEGVVTQVIHAQMYSYVEVINNGKRTWLAGPRTELKINTRVRYSKGVYMTNFFSKELDRAFPAVTFVGRLEIAE